MAKIQYNFKNRTALITGGAQGFGLDIAKRFLNYGIKLLKLIYLELSIVAER